MCKEMKTLVIIHMKVGIFDLYLGRDILCLVSTMVSNVFELVDSIKQENLT